MTTTKNKNSAPQKPLQSARKATEKWSLCTIDRNIITKIETAMEK